MYITYAKCSKRIIFCLLTQVIDISNQLFHSQDFKVTSDELKTKLADMVALLQDRTTLSKDSSAQEAVHDIQAVSHVHCPYCYGFVFHSYLALSIPRQIVCPTFSRTFCLLLTYP